MGPLGLILKIYHNERLSDTSATRPPLLALVVSAGTLVSGFSSLAVNYETAICVNTTTGPGIDFEGCLSIKFNFSVCYIMFHNHHSDCCAVELTDFITFLILHRYSNFFFDVGVH